MPDNPRYANRGHEQAAHNRRTAGCGSVSQGESKDALLVLWPLVYLPRLPGAT